MFQTKDAEFWAAAGVTFSIATSKDRNESKKFLIENFFPDEPVLRSTKVLTTAGFFARRIKNVLIKQFVDEPLSQNNSIIARNKVISQSMTVSFYDSVVTLRLWKLCDNLKLFHHDYDWLWWVNHNYEPIVIMVLIMIW